MNLVEAFPDGEHDSLRAVHAAGSTRTARASASSSACGPRRSRYGNPALPTIDVRVEVVEDLGSETHVFFQVDAPADHRGGAGIGFR